MCLTRGECVFERSAEVSSVLNTIGALFVYCDDDNDLPLTGACSPAMNAGEYTLTRSSSVDWTSGGTAAGWSCGWDFLPGHVQNNMDQTYAEICCVRRP